MAISEITGQKNSNGGGAAASVIFTYPSTPTEGNLLLAAFSYRLSGTTITAVPSGWAEAYPERRNGNINTNLYYKIAGAGEPLTHQWDLSASVKSAGFGAEFSSSESWDAGSLLGPGSSNSGTGTAGSSGTTATTNKPGTNMLVYNVYGSDNDGTWSAFSGAPAAIDSEAASVGGSKTTRNHTMVADGTTATNGTFSSSATLSISANWAVIIEVFYEGVASLSRPPYSQCIMF